jgi:hypothetical protein
MIKAHWFDNKNTFPAKTRIRKKEESQVKTAPVRRGESHVVLVTRLLHLYPLPRA